MKKTIKTIASVVFSMSLLVGCSQGAAPGSNGGQAAGPSGEASSMTKEAGVFIYAASGE